MSLLEMTERKTHQNRSFAVCGSSRCRCILLLGIVSISMSLLPLQSLALSSSSFHGARIITQSTTSPVLHGTNNNLRGPSNLVMRKQKASDKRTARMQRGQQVDNDASATTFTPPPLSTTTSATQILNSSPMNKSKWKQKKVELRAAGVNVNNNGNGGGGRGRARKRLKLYNSLASYHTTFLELISEEYRMEVSSLLRLFSFVLGDAPRCVT